MSTRASKAVASTRARSAARQRPTLKKRIKTFLALSALGIGIPLAIGSVYFLLIFMDESKKLPSMAEIGNLRPSEGTRIYYADGPLMAVFSTENRKPIKLDEMGNHVVDATIATEDSRFYQHKGVDTYGIARAVFKNVTGGEVREGASTITQQLARNISELGIGREKKLRRKVAEAILAMRIEQTFTKDEILEQYLNLIYFGNGAYGVEAAARTYFHKSAKELSLSQAAMLAGMPQRPSRYSSNLDAAYKRRDTVLQRMLDTGKITTGQFEEARLQKLKIHEPQTGGARIYGAPYFVNYVMKALVTEYGQDAVYSGWKIYTTLDSKMQKAAEDTLRAAIRRKDVAANVGALVSIDPKTGFIRAMVGGLDFKKNQFNVITQGIRQPGSAFKPIVYLAAFDTETATLDSTYTDNPYIPGIRDRKWRPKNYGGRYSNRAMRVRTALRNSVNTVAVKVAMDTGLDKVVYTARRLGLTTPIDEYAPMALGASGVRPLELCAAYATFANPDGRRPVPIAVTKVIDAKEEVILDARPRLENSGISPDAIKQIDEGLRDAVEHGTGYAAKAVPNAHGKTGTTSESRDAWFAGYTPELATVIWTAREVRDRRGRLSGKMPYAPMEGTTGGVLCAPIWRDYMLKALPIQIAYNKAAADRLRMAAVSDGDAKKKAEENKKPSTASLDKNKPAAEQANETTAPSGLEAPATGGPNIADPNAAPPAAGTGAGTLPEPSAGNTGFVPPPSTPPPSARMEATSRISEPPSRLAAPTIDPADEIVTVRICAETSRRANQWCSVTLEQKMRKRDRPGTCRRHKDPDAGR